MSGVAMKIKSLLIPFLIIGWNSQSIALTPVSYRVELETHFDEGALELPQAKQHRLEELADYLDDFSSARIYVVAYGDVEVGDGASGKEAAMGRARANFVSAIFTKRADPTLEPINVETEPIRELSQAGLVKIAIKGICRHGIAACDEHWRGHTP